MPKPSGTENIRESTILLGNIFWLAALASLIIALVYPIYCYLSLNIDIVIDPDYFYKVFIPICIPIILLASITPRLDQKWWLRVAVIIVLSAIIALAINNKIELGIIAGMICFASICLIGQTLDYVLVESHYFSKNLPSNKISLFLAHGGFGLLALAIVLNCALSREVKFIGQVGDKINQKGLSVKLENVKFSESLNYFRQIAVFRIEDEKNNIVTLKPENRLYKIEKSLSQEVDIFSFLFYDLYAVLSQVDQKTIHAQIYYQPFISFIWLSVIIIASGFLISVRKK
ncbi:MAG: hypothetical protein Tsb006_1680 [Rickettsiaceae bacterium]